MSKASIHGIQRTLTASSVREAIARDLSQIKHEDRLTFGDIGRVLGKSEDQAAKYCDGSASMCAETYAFARAEWNGRFTGTLDALIEARRPTLNDRAKLCTILGAASEVAQALENDNEMDPSEVRKARQKLEAAQESLCSLLSRLTVRAA